MSDDRFTDEKVEMVDGKPFVLAWVEKTTIDRLRSGDLVFSEAVKGLAADTAEDSEPEKVESKSDPVTGGVIVETSITF